MAYKVEITEKVQEEAHEAIRFIIEDGTVYVIRITGLTQPVRKPISSLNLR
ncbi:MAG: hypothetical protein L0287_04190 [Anaerolineae bacterium]|nr:hypothetical protein [Acidobacteriota bacterium]MCI0550133.1 hypothetical protein [Anaerolineae bacterium]